MRNLFVLVVACVAVLNCTKKEYTGLDLEYCPPPDSSQHSARTKPSISRINVFLETSGSMAGYMPNSQPATEFQSLIPDVLSILNTQYNQAVNFYSIYDSKTSYRKLELGDARDKILHGAFNWSGSTYLPVMLDSINQYLKADAVNIFITDAIYSPESKNQKVAVLAATDIREKIAPYVDSYSVFTFCLFSKFGNTAKSPYYFIIQGKPNNILEVEKLVAKTIDRNNQTFEDINFGWSNSLGYYTILPYTETTPNFTAEPCESYKDAFVKLNNISLSDDSVSFWMGIDLQNFPDYATSETYLSNNHELKIEGGVGKVTAIQNKLPKGIDADDQEIASKCTHFFQIKISEINTPVSLLSLSLKYSRPEWVSRLNENENEKLREKTYGLERIVSGYEQAYMQGNAAYFFKDVNISLIKR